jgi:hypothetical protein
MLPEASNVIPIGVDSPDERTVVTTLELAFHILIALFDVSEKYALPLPSTAILLGLLNTRVTKVELVVFHYGMCIGDKNISQRPNRNSL